jgi:hypothetical protein
MSGPQCRDFRELLGVYVVGAVEPRERAELEAHLTRCHDCREELAGLAALPALLHRIPVSEAEQIAQPGQLDLVNEADPAPDVLSGLLAEVGARRRSRRIRGMLAAAAAVLVALGGGVAVAAAVEQPARQAASVPMEVVRAHQGKVDVTVRYVRSRWGTEIWVRVRGLPEWTDCKFLVATRSGHQVLAGGWLAGPYSGSLWYPTLAGVQAADITGFTLTAAGKVLVTIPVS